MTDHAKQPATPDDRPRVTLPPMCQHHDADLIRRQLRIPPTGPWAVTIAACGMLLYRRVMMRPEIAARAERDLRNLSLVFAEIGCLACYDRAAYADAVALLKAGGYEHALQVATGKAADLRFPVRRRRQ